MTLSLASCGKSTVVEAPATTATTIEAESSSVAETTTVTEEAKESTETVDNVTQLDVIDPDGNATTIDGFVKEGVPVPYVDAVEYMNKVYDPANEFSLSSNGSGVYEISNAKGNMIVDTTKDTLHSDKIEQFLYNDQRLDPTDDSEYVFEHIIDTDYRENPSALDIDLSKYGIDIIEKDGRVFFPLTTVADLTAVSYINTIYYDNKIYLNYGGNTDLITDIILDLEGTEAYAEFGRIVKQEPDDPRTALFQKWYGDSTGKMAAKMAIKEYDCEFDKYQAIFDEETEDGNRYRYYEYNNTGIFVYTNYDENVVKTLRKLSILLRSMA